jgi:ATP-dependent helicase/nuclease subunit A
VHRLVEVLPAKNPDHWMQLAKDMTPDTLDTAIAEAARDEALQVLRNESLSWVFADDSLSEVPVQGEIDGKAFFGTIDKLIVTPKRITLVDFKTNLAVPTSPDQCPSGVMAQMGAYLALIAAIYPDRQIDVGILWTANQSYMSLPHNMVRQAMREAPYLDGATSAT